MMYAATTRWKQRRGAAVAELAVFMTLLLTMLMGMFEMSQAMQMKEVLNNAARKGCRTGIQRNASSTDIYNDVMNVMTDHGYDSTKFNPAAPGVKSTSSNIGQINITVTDTSGNSLTDALGAESGSTVTVQVVIPISSVLWTSPLFLQLSQLESETVVMMKQ